MKHLKNQKKPVAQDWHPADVIAALRKIGWSVSQLSLTHGLSRHTLGKALQFPYPKGERLIANALGVQPQKIWPSRYTADGQTNRTRGRKPMRPAGAPLPPVVRTTLQQSSPAQTVSNTKQQAAA